MTTNHHTFHIKTPRLTDHPPPSFPTSIQSITQEVLLAQVSALLDVAPGNVELVAPQEADVAAALQLHQKKAGAAADSTTPLALRLHLGPGKAEAKAAEVSAAVQSPAFADALMGKLKAAGGGGFAALSGVAAGPGRVAALAGPAVGAEGPGAVEGGKAAPVEDARDLGVFLWDIVGGGAAVFVVLMLLVRVRWAHWQRLAADEQAGAGAAAPGGEGGAGGPTAAGASSSSAAILNRIRQGTESIGTPSALKFAAGGSKPDTRSYELVETGRGGEGVVIGAMGAGGAKAGEEEEEDIEMI